MDDDEDDLRNGLALMSAEERYEAAIALKGLLGPDTWIQGNYHSRDDNREEREGCYCLLGAAIKALNPEADMEQDCGLYETAAGRFVAAAIDEFADGPPAPSQQVIDWNDAHGRTWDEVDGVLRRIVAHYESLLPRGFV
jgi:hypothetical protein